MERSLGKWALRKLAEKVTRLGRRGGVLFLEFSLTQEDFDNLRQSVRGVEFFAPVLRFSDGDVVVVSAAPSLPEAWHILCAALEEFCRESNEDRSKAKALLQKIASDVLSDRGINLIEPDWFQ